ncbi:MAG TPA: hypothetical protein VIL46_05565, partial [Gemmataceae bacterium]
MPIRFYCVFCNKQLGIATRKAGAVVTCPNCKQKLRVPVPEEKKADPPGSVPFRTERPPAGGAAVSTVAPRSADPGSRPSGVGGNPVRAVPTPRMPPGQLFEQSDFDEFLRQQAPPRPAPAAGSPGDAGMELEL